MITFLTGVPGSGKTYKAVYTIFNNFSNNEKAKKDLKKDFINCYTNINEFKFDNVEHVYKLDFDDLKVKLVKLHKLYKDKVSDDILIEKCKEFDIYKTLFVIDEAHNYFDTNDIVLVWWLSYHRHLYQDIYLITQNLSLIFTKYKTFSEFFYRAKSTAVSLDRKTFKYDVYINSRLAMNSRSHTEKLPKLKEVFDLYHSGDSVSVSNILLKFYIFAFFMVLSGVLFSYFYFSDSASKSHLDKNITQIQTSLPAPAVVNSTPVQNYSTPVQNYSIPPHDNKYSSKIFIELTCNFSSCYNKDIYLPIPLFEYYIKNKTIKLLYSKKINNNLYKYYVDTSIDFHSYISNKGLQNEASINGPVSPVTTFNGK